MARVVNKLTDVQVRGWIKAATPVAKADGDGLTFTLSKSGTAAWVLRYRFAGRPRELSLGQYPGLTIAAARDRAKKERVLIQQGVDVAALRRREKAEAAAAQTFRQLALDYMERKLPALAATTRKQRRQHIEGVILPRMAGRDARSITASDVVELLHSIGRAKTRAVTDLVFTALSELFKFGLACHAVTSNPCSGITVNAVLGAATAPRQRLKLSEGELRDVMPALPRIGESNALAVKLLLFTCVRLGELTRAEWSDVDLERAEWRIPDANSKTGSGFVVPLAPSAVEAFRGLLKLARESRFVMPARQSRRGDTFCEQRGLNAAVHRLCDGLKDKVRRFTPHDLRSTARSHLSELGVNVIVAERCLNHRLGGLIGIYDQYDYLTERRAALETLGAFITACETGEPWRAGNNVVQIRTATGR